MLASRFGSRGGAPSNVRSPLAVAVTIALLGSFLPGCASYRHGNTDAEGARIEAQKHRAVSEFRRDELIDPRTLPEDASSAEATASDLSATDIAVPDPLRLADAITIATEHNRNYQANREQLFLAALDLGVTRRDFLRPVFDGSLDYSFSDGSGIDSSDVVSLSLGGDYLLFTGGTLALSSNWDLARSPTDPGADQSTDGSTTLSISQPLLQGAGHTIAFEGLTQAERNLLYDARDFELFRQDFVIGIIDDYYALLSQKQQLENSRQNIERQQFAYEQAQALFRLGRGDSLSVFRAEQSVLQAQTAYLTAEQGFAVALDRFKIQLGLPTAVEFAIEDEFPSLVELSIGLEGAVEAALHNRLDLRTTRDQLEDRRRALRIAEDRLLPRLNLTASYTTSTDAATSLQGLDFHEEDAASIGLSLEIPFDRKSERAALRSAELSLLQSERNLVQREDEVILDVRNSLGTLRQRRAQIEIGEREIRSLELSLEKASLEFESGLATNRDVTEAADELTDAKNEQLDRIVDHEIARLTLLRQLGLLFVDESGQVDE